jgi:hypothetical protein
MRETMAGLVQAYALPGLGGRLVLAGAPELLPALNRVLHGWTPLPTGLPSEGEVPLCEVTRRGSAYDLSSPWLEGPLAGLPLASAVCGVVADLAQAWFAQRPGSLALHCGAAVLGGRLLAFTGPAHAGKSTLIARLGAEPGITLFGDDMLPLRPDGMAHAMGFAPRLRIPLPEAATPDFRAHVAGHTRLADPDYAHVLPPSLAPHGTSLPLSGLVALDRRAAGPARLHHMPTTDIVRHLLARNMTDPDDAVVGAIPALAGRLLGLRLVYAELEDAVALLRRALCGPVPLSPGVEVAPALVDPTAAERPAAPVGPRQRWRRAPGVVPRRVGRETFLWQRDAQRFLHLNPMASAVWLLLEEATSAQDITALLAEAFPATPPAQIAGDVAALLGRLAARGLVEPG